MDGLRVSILGVGLLGGSVALAARRKLIGCYISGYAHRENTLQAATAAGMIDRGCANPADAVRDAQVVVLCTPVGVFPEMLKQIAPALAAGAIVTDVGSTKQTVVAAAEALLPSTASFVGSHPIAGSEKRGIAHARADLLEGSLCILTPTSQTSIDALGRVEEFWQSLGMRTTRMSPALHDQRLAEVSHLPHALAAALLMFADRESLSLAGKGLADLTRIAGGDAGLWRDILLDNRDAVRQSLQKLAGELEHFSGLLEAERSDELYAWLEAAAARRASLMGRHTPPSAG